MRKIEIPEDDDEGPPPVPGVWYFCERCDVLQNRPICKVCLAFARDFDTVFDPNW